MTTEKPIPYNVELYVVTAWNGAGTPVVFSSKEACEEMLSVYDNFRADTNFPWVYDREAVNGDRILDLFRNGLRPWKVYLGIEGNVVSIKPIPLHHITLKLVTERYEKGAPRNLEVWAASRDFARVHVGNMLNTEDKVKLLMDLDKEWSFDAWIEEQSAEAAPPEPSTPGLEDEVDFYTDAQKEKQAELAGVLPKAPPPTPASQPHQAIIPGFGKVVDLRNL